MTTTARLFAVGASNLARIALPLLDAARAAAAGPVEAHFALGRGRSYGLRSSLLGRTLPSIDDCGMWRLLAAAPQASGTGIVMDVGNDLLYGVEVSRILTWVETTLHRLAIHTDRRVVVGLPMQTLRRLPSWRYTLVRSVLVPSCRLSLSQMLDAAERLHTGLGELAAAAAATFHEPSPSWYGFDPVHFRRRFWHNAAHQWLNLPADTPSPRPPCDGVCARLRFLFARPAERTLLGHEQAQRQPARTWADGTTLSLW